VSGKKASGGEWAPAFLAALRNSANVRASCQAAGVAREHAYRYRKTHPGFARQWKGALEDACDVLEAEARKRASSGSDLLLIFLLKAHRPDVYRETVRHQIDLEGEVARLAEQYGVAPEKVRELAQTGLRVVR
jgi:hypothetical protein